MTGASDPGGGPAGSEESLGEAFATVARRLRATSLEALAQWDVTPSQLRAMRVLMRHGVMRPSELSTHLRIAPRSATEVVDDLVAKGFLSRSPDPRDRRATMLELTPQGEELGARLRAARGEESERIFARLSAADRDHLARILRALRDD